MSQESIDAARVLIPSWVGYAGVLWIPAITFAMCAGLTYFGVRVALVGADGISSTSWTERARASYPARVVASSLLWICVGFMTLFLTDHHNPFLHISLTTVAALCFPSCVLAVAVVDRSIARRLGARVPPRARWARQFATRWLANPSWLILGVLVITMPATLSLSAIAIAAIGLMALLSINLFGMPRLLCRIGLAWPASPRLLAVVGKASEKMGLTPAAVYEIDSAAANAFALPFPRQLVFTRPALEVLDDEQLVAVCCHELAHIDEPRAVKTIRIASSLLIFPLALSNLVYGRFGEEGVWILLALVFAASFRLRALRQRMETRADAAAHQHESDEGVYAAALERIHRASNVPAVVSRNRTHPDLYDRMVASGVTPTYQRPAPPAMKRAYVSQALCVGILLGYAIGFIVWSSSSARASRLSESASMWRIAIGAGKAPVFARLGDLRLLDRHTDQAATFYECASELAPYSIVYRAKFATALSELGRCDEAGELLAGREYDLKYYRYSGDTVASTIRSAKAALGNCSPAASL